MKKPIYLIVVLLAGLLVQACSNSPQTVRVPTELSPLMTPYDLALQWRVEVDKMDAADGRGLTIGYDDEKVYMASASGELTALWKANQARYTDQVAWQIRFEPRVVAGPVVAGDHVIVGTSKGDVLALDAQDGRMIWQTRLNSEVISTPVIERNRVLVRTNDGRVVALNLQDGDSIWTAEHQMPSLFLRGAAPVLVDGNRVFVGRETGFVEALDFATGEQIWEARLALPQGRTDLERMVDIQAALVMDRGRLFALSYNGRMAALNPANGNFIWVKDFSGYRDFVVKDSVVFIVDSDDIVRALDPETGTEYWTQSGLKYRRVSDLKLDEFNNQLLLSDGLGYVHWLNLRDGGFTARSRHASHLDAGQNILAIHQEDERYYLLDSDGTMAAYTLNPRDENKVE